MRHKHRGRWLDDIHQHCPNRSGRKDHEFRLLKEQPLEAVYFCVFCLDVVRVKYP